MREMPEAVARQAAERYNKSEGRRYKEILLQGREFRLLFELQCHITQRTVTRHLLKRQSRRKVTAACHGLPFGFPLCLLQCSIKGKHLRLLFVFS